MATDQASQQPNMELYVRANKKRDDPPAAENEIRVQASGKLRQYISYALALLQEKGHRTVLLKGMGRAINKAVGIAEIVKRRVAGLHQLTDMGSMLLTDVYEPKQEGLERLEVNRNVSIVTITLSLDPLDSSLPGYQAPIPEDQVQPELQPGDLEARPRRSGGRGRGRDRGRGRGRGGAGGAPATEGEQAAAAADGAEGAAAAPSGGRGRRRYRGRGRGGAAAGAANGEAGAANGADNGGEGGDNAQTGAPRRPRNRGNRRGRGRGQGGAAAEGGAAPEAAAGDAAAAQ